MSDLSNPHDKFFKELFGQPDRAADFIVHYLSSAIVGLLDLTTIELVKDSFVDEDLREHFSDLLYKVRLKSGSETFIYILFEHKSAPERWTAFQMLRYLVRIWERLLAQGVKKLPAILPIVFYHGVTTWNAPRLLSELIELGGAEELREFQPEFAYHLFDLTEYDSEEIRGEAVLRAGLSMMRYAFSEELSQKLVEIFRILQPLSDQNAIEYLRTILIYLANISERPSEEEIQMAVNEAFAGSGIGRKAAFAKSWIQEGRTEEARDMTLRQLQRRFGPLTEEVQTQIRALPYEQVQVLSEALLDFTSLNDLSAWLGQNANEAPVT